MKYDAQHRLNSLQEAGDDLERNRPIYHLIRFEDEDNASAFRYEVANKGYVISQGETKHDLMVLHVLPLDLVKLMAHAYSLADCAKKYQGTYIDWQIYHA